MGLLSFFKKLFAGNSVEQAELDAARERHGIKMTFQEKMEADDITKPKRTIDEYEAWEELRHYRTDFFFGRWVTNKFHIIGEDKIKKELAELEQKRQEKARQKQQNIKGEGEG